MNTWWYYYYSALLQINWNSHQALKSISPNPVLLHSLVLKIAAAVWQFSLKLGLSVEYIINMRLVSWHGSVSLVSCQADTVTDFTSSSSRIQTLCCHNLSEPAVTRKIKTVQILVQNCLYFYFSDHDLCLLFLDLDLDFGATSSRV